jgi:hypothetical protein
MSLLESRLSSNPSSPGIPASWWERLRSRLGGVLYVLLCVEIGIFLLVMPWSPVWDRSLLLRYYPLLRPVLMSSYLRGAISGLGLVNVWLGVSQAWSFRRSPSGEYPGV